MLVILVVMGFGPAIARSEKQPPVLPQTQWNRVSYVILFTPKSRKEPVLNKDSGAVPGPADSLPASPEAGPKIPKEIQVTRFDDVQKNVTLWSDGTRTEDWVSGKYLIQKNPYAAGLNISDMEIYSLEDEWFFYTKKSLFSWLSPAVYMEEAGFEGHMTSLYQRKVAGGEMVEQAWMDTNTGLPVAYQKASYLCKWTFGNPPTAALAIPQEYAKALARYLEVADPGKARSNKR